MCYPVKRIFIPKRTDDLTVRALPFVGKEVTVRSWHSITPSYKSKYPDDDKVGFVEEFAGDIPESELK